MNEHPTGMGAMLHDSRDAVYRSPAGAQKAGTVVRLCLRAPLGVPVTLRLWEQATGERRLPMREETPGFYSIQFPLPEQSCLLWYWFEVDLPGGRVYYGNAADRLGGIGHAYAHHPPSFQITVYDPAFETPKWFRDGVMYQVFPDRFARADAPPVPGRRMLDWERFDPKVDFRGTLIDGEEVSDYFFGGNLRGITQKLPYLKSLGVSILYLNPIFAARSNHRYDVGDYHTIDPVLGTRADFEALCKQAKAMGIRVVLDGVFSHTGADSVYFNRYGSYPGVGAYQSTASPYHAWYAFKHWPGDYDCWWGHPSLPHVNELEPSYMEFILGEDGVVPAWLSRGASGWRLDVADELPIEFVTALRRAVKAQDPDAIIIGEVWEDATHKVSYSQMRPYALGHQLDSVMNYPLRNALLDFFLHREDARAVMRRLLSLQENYPPPMFHALMNFSGTHDVPRLRTLLSGAEVESAWLREDMLDKPYRDTSGIGQARMAAFLAALFALPGVPSVYYGDEIGMQGLSDPFCRMPFEWKNQGQGASAWIAQLAQLRRECASLRGGTLIALDAGPDVLCFLRSVQGGQNVVGESEADETLLFAVNRRGECQNLCVDIPGFTLALDTQWMGTAYTDSTAETTDFTLPAYGCILAKLARQ